ncbi:uncharacterized protein LOC135076722 [Ostrinia nubilalis]|uniref:uncharacterized protein LOC135076722 n=1 Tax=Ostrinia nubilalis TaxID=29057 RepID=UPI003082656C
MATMVKEKRREKKKTKQKHEPKPVFIAESTSAANLPIVEEIQISKVAEVTLGDESKSTSSLEDKLNSETVNVIEKEINLDSDAFSKEEEEAIPPETGPKEILCKEKNVATEAMPSAQSANAPDHAYTDLNLKLERMCIPVNPVPVSKEREFSMGAESAYLVKEVTDQVVVSTSIVPLSNETLMDNASAHIVSEMEDISPSAPTLEYSEPQVFYQEEVIAPEVPKLTSLPLEEAIRVYGGAEMAEVMAMSEREEAIVEAGDMSGPEHPLVDFLSTFKRSLIALERERIQLSVSFAEEEKYRNSLWKIEKQYINHYEKCKCGEGIFFKATYEHAEFQKDKLPVARMKLESIMRDVQDSYCLHQHSALLAHCQIEEFISEVVVRNKSEIREALSLVLQALKLSDNAPGVLSSALRRWAAALAAALVDRRDPRQLLFLLHHLFRCVLHSDVTRCSERHALGVLSSALRRWAAALAAALVDRRDPRQLLFLLHHLFRCVLHSDVTRCSERHAPGVLSSALRRWAAALAAALVDRRDPRQLLFLLHHLFRCVLHSDVTRCSERHAPGVLSSALRRWAAALAAALVDRRDPRQLLFLLHHLFRCVLHSDVTRCSERHAPGVLSSALRRWAAALAAALVDRRDPRQLLFLLHHLFRCVLHSDVTRCSERHAPGVLSSALRRWAAALAAALVDRRDPRQLLFLLHHLFRCVLHSDVTRCSERHAPGVLSSALRRWAAALAAALVDRRDPRQLLFLLHHLFRCVLHSDVTRCSERHAPGVLSSALRRWAAALAAALVDRRDPRQLLFLLHHLFRCVLHSDACYRAR